MITQVDIVSQIYNALPNLREAEKKVAQVITENLTFSAEASITELAEAAEVSEATITRFAKSVGCRNVRDLKVKLAQCSTLGQRFVDKPVLSDTESLFSAIHQMLDVHQNLVCEETIEKVIDALLNARQIFVFGSGGSSSVMAMEAQNRFFRLGFSSVVHNDSLMGRMVASVMQATDVLVVFSITGRTPEVIDLAAIAKQYGAKVVAFTSVDSPLSEIADYVFRVETSEGDDIFRPTTSRYALMAQLDVLSMKLAHSREDVVRENLRRIKINLDIHRGGSERQPLGD